jgi:hypothetical protein
MTAGCNIPSLRRVHCFGAVGGEMARCILGVVFFIFFQRGTWWSTDLLGVKNFPYVEEDAYFHFYLCYRLD